MLNNVVDFKAKSFLSERNTSTMAYEVKAVRAIWDPSLSIPGTNRRGGFRCPVGTRYGGQITDRFGRSCGWGVARRIANQIADIGERMENVDDARRGRRIARRERRILQRLNPEGGGAGRLERGLRGVAERLDGADAPSPAPRGGRRRTVKPRPPSVDAPEAVSTPEAPRAPRRRRAPNLRDSEQRRMDREIEQPGAPRTGESPARPVRPRRPVKPRGEGNLRVSEQRRMDREINEPGAPRTGEAPARRRRRAVVETAKPPKPQQEEAKKPKPIVEPKVVKPRRPKPARGDSDNAARSAEVRAEAAQQAVEKPKTPKPKAVKQRAINLNDALRDDTFVERINRDVLGKRLEILNDPKNFTGANDRNAEEKKRTALRIAETNIIALTARLERIQQAQDRGDVSPLDVVRGADREMNVRELKEEIESVIEAWGDVVKHNKPPSVNKPEVVPDAKPNVPAKPKTPDAPETLKFEPQLADVAKLSPENEALVERLFNEILTPEERARFNLNVDAYSFNENEGRQSAVRDFNYALLQEAEKYAQNPQQYGDVQNRLLALQAQFLERIGVDGNYRTKQQIEARLVELKEKQQENWRLLANPRGANDMEKDRFRAGVMTKLAENQGKIGRYEQGLSLLNKLEPEIRKAIQRQEQGLVFNPDAPGVVKPLDEDVIKKINSQIADAIKRRQGKLAAYLKKRDPNNTAKYIDMTKEKFDALTPSEKKAYLVEAYGHSRIEGANGKLYNAVASVSGSGRSFSVSVQFNEIDKDGNVLRNVGSSSRTINTSHVYQNSMFITSKLDRGADIQTIYNQHAFLYLKKMGLSSAKVGAVDDGRYVWARVGFINPRSLGSGDLAVLEKELRFFEKFGAGGLIGSEAEYMRIRSILSQARQGKTFSHQEIIFAIDDPSGNKPRGEFVKQWFVKNLGSGGGTLSFAKQKIGVPAGGTRRAPRRRNP